MNMFYRCAPIAWGPRSNMFTNRTTLISPPTSPRSLRSTCYIFPIDRLEFSNRPNLIFQSKKCHWGILSRPWKSTRAPKPKDNCSSLIESERMVVSEWGELKWGVSGRQSSRAAESKRVGTTGSNRTLLLRKSLRTANKWRSEVECSHGPDSCRRGSRTRPYNSWCGSLNNNN